jgi:hypothetical protein
MAQFYFRSHSNLLRRWGNIQSALTTTHGCCATPLSTIIPGSIVRLSPRLRDHNRRVTRTRGGLIWNHRNNDEECA